VIRPSDAGLRAAAAAARCRVSRGRATFGARPATTCIAPQASRATCGQRSTLKLWSCSADRSPDRKAELREEIGAINPRVIFVHGLAGIPGLIINQVQGAFASRPPRRHRGTDLHARRAVDPADPSPAPPTSR
jgi:hypothetical protein